jgi:tetratricopeptide (TPR) repeat protein
MAFLLERGARSLALGAAALVVIPWALQAEDVVVLKDATSHPGEVVDLGGNRIELMLSAGAKRILKRDIDKVRFDENRSRKEIESTDVVIRQGGHKIRGAVEVIDGGRKVQITLPEGMKAVLPRKDVIRIIRRGEFIEHDTTVYTRELGEGIRAAIESLLQANVETPDEALRRTETFLTNCGIFAVGPVREALSTAVADSPAARVLARVDRQYRLREVVATAIEEAEAGVYRILSDGTVAEKCDFLVQTFPRFVEESVPLAEFLARDAGEDPTVRAWSVDFLRRMQRNQEILRIYKESTGQVQLASAIALGRNRILIGMPTLIEALELDALEMRQLAAKHLQAFTGKDFHFRPDGAPQARREAVAKWHAWWSENEAAVKTLSENVLRKTGAAAPERIAAQNLWKEACASLESKDVAKAENLFRQASVMDPGFVPAAVGLGAILYSELGKPDEAVKTLEDLRSRVTAEWTVQDREWIQLHLGNALRLKGDLEGAAAAYEQCRRLAPENVHAIMSLAEVTFAAATRVENMRPEERTLRLRSALESYEKAASLFDRFGGELSTLRIEELPPGVELPFNRREHNRSVIDLRRMYRLRKQESVFQSAKIRSLLGEQKEAVLLLRAGIDDLALEDSAQARKVETGMRSYLGVLYEEMGQPLLALKEYRKVLADLDAENPECLRGMERLRRQGKAGAQGN